MMVMTVRESSVHWCEFRVGRDSLNNSPSVTSSASSNAAAAPRSLNSDISYFGVGGKQAVFFIGTATRVGGLDMA